MKKSLITSLFFIVFGLFFNSITAQSTVYLSSNSGSYSVIEGNTYSFSVNLYSVSTTPIVVDITTTAGTAGLSDYTSLTTTVTIPAGQLYSSASLSIATTNDTTIEPNETFTINGTITSGNTTNTTTTTQVFIIDNDTVPAVSTSYYNNSNTISINESTNATVYFYLSNPYSSNVVINCATATGTAGTADFTTVNSTITIPAGQTQGYQTIIIANDAITEPDESFTLTGTITSGNTTNSTITSTITIIDNDTTPTISTFNSSISTTEGQSAYVYVQLNRPFNTNVVIQYNTTTGTAGTADFTSTNSTTTILAGNVLATLIIPTTDDILDEPEETFTVTVNVTSGNTTNTTFASTVTIIDNDGLPDFSIENNEVPAASSFEVEEGQNVLFYLRLTHASPTDTVVQLYTTNGTAGSSDYTSFSTTATIPAGQIYLQSSAFTIATILDPLQESNETFTITGTVTSSNTYNSSSSQIATILDNYSINAQTDNVIAVAEVGTTFPLLANDTLHGLPLNASDATVTLVGTNTIGATINAQGVLTIPANVPIGAYYQLSYQICEAANPSSCDIASITIEVQSPLQATYNLSYSDFNGDGFTSVGDLITYQITITNIGNAALTAIQVDQAFNITILGGPIASLNPGQSDSTTFTATHILTQDDINFGAFQNTPNQGLELSFKGIYYGYEVVGWAEQQNPFNLNISDGIRLKTFVDTNSNGLQDGSEINFPLGHFNYEINNDGVIHNLYSTPYYLYESNPTTTYNLSYIVDSDYAANNTCAVSYPNVTVATGSGITTYNFPISVTPYQDLSINLMSYSPAARPGFYYPQLITYTNNSNQTVASGTITFTKDTALSIYTISESSATITPTGFTYNFTNLLPYQTSYISIVMLVPTIPTVTLGQLLTNSTTITIPAADILPLNNTSSITQTIVGSYDPNDKTESHGGQIVQSGFTANDYLTYTIRFENTGTASAINVVVEDILDSKLEPSSIKMIDASATYSLERIGNHLKWTFSAIDLPPSVPNDEITGHGYIVFKVKPKPGYVIGDIIENTAEIYFDFNPAIVTNTCTTEFVQALGINPIAFNNFNYFPNPVKNTLTISNKVTIDTIEITSVLGQTMVSKKVNELQTEINLSELSNGIYFVKINSEGQEKTIKVIKE